MDGQSENAKYVIEQFEKMDALWVIGKELLRLLGSTGDADVIERTALNTNTVPPYVFHTSVGKVSCDLNTFIAKVTNESAMELRVFHDDYLSGTEPVFAICFNSERSIFWSTVEISGFDAFPVAGSELYTKFGYELKAAIFTSVLLGMKK